MAAPHPPAGLPSWVDATQIQEWLACGRISKATYVDDLDKLTNCSDLEVGLNGLAYKLKAVITTEPAKKAVLAGFIASTNGTGPQDVFIGWRGTVLPEEWNTDAKVDLKRWSAGMVVHEGFLKLYSSARTSITNIADTWVKESAVKDSWSRLLEGHHQIRRIYVTGHSLGGALATLCAYDIAKISPEFAEKVKLVTFSGPRALHVESACVIDTIVRDHVRLYTDGDLVPAFPLYLADDSAARGPPLGVVISNLVPLLWRFMDQIKNAVLNRGVAAKYHHAGLGVVVSGSALPQEIRRHIGTWGMWEHHDLRLILYLLGSKDEHFEQGSVVPPPRGDGKGGGGR